MPRRHEGLTSSGSQISRRDRESRDGVGGIQRLGKIGPITEMLSGEREMLYELLDSGEDIQALVGGVYRAEGSTKGSTGVAVATNRRVLIIDKGIFGNTEVSEIPYGRIEGLTYSTGMRYGGVQILGVGGTAWRMEMVQPQPQSTERINVAAL